MVGVRDLRKQRVLLILKVQNQEDPEFRYDSVTRLISAARTAIEQLDEKTRATTTVCHAFTTRPRPTAATTDAHSVNDRRESRAWMIDKPSQIRVHRAAAKRCGIASQVRSICRRQYSLRLNR